MPMIVREDNTAAIQVVRKGYSPSLRHQPRCQRIAVGSLHELFCDNDAHDKTDGPIELVHADTSTHKADVFTKDMSPRDFMSFTII